MSTLAHNINMRTSSITERAARPDVNRGLQVKRSPSKGPSQRTRANECHGCIALPQNVRDRIILFMFTCCLVAFLDAFFCFSSVDEDIRASNVTFVHPRTRFPTSSPWSWSSVTSNDDQKIRAESTLLEMVDWHGNYESFPSTANTLLSPATIPQDAFPDPTPALIRTERGQIRGNGSHAMTTKSRAVVVPRTTFGDGPPRLGPAESDKGSENHGRYLVAGPPRTAPRGTRPRRFGRCLPGEACS